MHKKITVLAVICTILLSGLMSGCATTKVTQKGETSAAQDTVTRANADTGKAAKEDISGFEGRFAVVGQYLRNLQHREYKAAYALLTDIPAKYGYLNLETFIAAQNNLDRRYGPIVSFKALTSEEAIRHFEESNEWMRQRGLPDDGGPLYIEENTIYVRYERSKMKYTVPFSVVGMPSEGYKVKAPLNWAYVNVTTKKPFAGYVLGVKVASFNAQDVYEEWHGTPQTVYRAPGSIGIFNINYPVWSGWEHDILLLAEDGTKVSIPISGDGHRKDADPNMPVRL